MKIAPTLALLTLAALLTLLDARQQPLHNLRAIKENTKKRAKRERKLFLEETFGNPYSFVQDSNTEDDMHHRNLMLYMDIAAKQNEIRKLMDLVGNFGDRMDDLVEAVTSQITQISMAANFHDNYSNRAKI